MNTSSLLLLSPVRKLGEHDSLADYAEELSSASVQELPDNIPGLIAKDSHLRM